MGLEEDFEYLEKTGLMDREKALGKEAHDHLLELEGKAEEVKRGEIKEKMICLYCGERAEANPSRFTALHKCDKPMIVEEKKWPMPSRPIQEIFFKVIYDKKTYRFLDYESAMKFRRLLWLEEVPLKTVLLDNTLRWYK